LGKSAPRRAHPLYREGAKLTSFNMAQPQAAFHTDFLRALVLECGVILSSLRPSFALMLGYIRPVRTPLKA
jgi:hypothetical protein